MQHEEGEKKVHLYMTWWDEWWEQRLKRVDHTE